MASSRSRHSIMAAAAAAAAAIAAAATLIVLLAGQVAGAVPQEDPLEPYQEYLEELQRYADEVRAYTAEYEAYVAAQVDYAAELRAYIEANVGVQLEEVPDNPPTQNPTDVDAWLRYSADLRAYNDQLQAFIVHNLLPYIGGQSGLQSPYVKASQDYSRNRVTLKNEVGGEDPATHHQRSPYVRHTSETGELPTIFG